jgi:hypothetical protein
MREVKATAAAVGVVMMGLGAALAGFAFVLMYAIPPAGNPAGEAVGSAAVQAGRAASDGQGGGWTPRSIPAGERTIEVIDRVSPAAWKVTGAARWLDRYTGSQMKMVTACSGKAYRCIVIKGGKVKGLPVGWSSGQTITIDTGKAQRRGYTAAMRKWLLVHELGHQFGLRHTDGRHIMNPSEGGWKMTFTSAQRAHLKKR